MKILCSMLLGLLFINSADAYTVNVVMEGREIYGYNQPRYLIESSAAREEKGLVITAIAKDKNFPFSDEWQGTILNKVFTNLYDKTNIVLKLTYYGNDYDEKVYNFEIGKYTEEKALFEEYYKEYKFSSNKFVYPALFSNNIHVIYPYNSKINVATVDELKKYKGIEVKIDKKSEIVRKEIAKLGVSEVENYDKAFELLLTEKVDYIIASYYPSIIASYKLGVKNFIKYSKNSIWKMPVFLRVTSDIYKDKRIKDLSAYLQSNKYKSALENAFKEMIELYEESTRGVIPPTYISNTSEETLSTEKEEKKSETNDDSSFFSQTD